MAPRHSADSSRYDRDRDRGGGRRYNPSPSRRSRSPPRRDRSRDRDRDRRDRSRDRGDRYSGSHRDDHYRGSNRNRDGRRDRESYGRLRSPDRRDRSRDRHSGYRGEREYGGSREYSDRDHHRGYNDREHNDRDRRRRSLSHSSRPGSRASATPGPQSGRDRVDGSRRDEKKKDPETEAKDKQAEKLARLAEWKKRNAERLAKDKPDTPGSGMSPNVTAPSTPTVATTPSASENKDDTSLAKAKVIQKSATEKLKQKQSEKSTFKLDASATARPLMAKAAGKPVTSAANNIAAQQAKANGNIGSFGLKNKSAVDAETAKNSVLGDEDNTGKRKFQALPEFTPNDEAESAADDADDAEGYAAMSDIGSDDEDAKAQLQAQLEKRREELAAENLVNEDTAMEEAPPANDNVDKMDVDQTAEEDEVDPLDAFMAGLSEPQPARAAPAFGQAMFNDDLEPEQTSVEAEDLIALKKAANAKKKKKEVPVVDHSKIEYEPFRKDFYVEPAEITQMTTEEIADLRHDLDGIKVKPGNVPRPVTKWAQMGLLQATMDVFTKLRFEKPTSIQAQAIPIIESGRDLVGIAKTGSGKTLAFGIPMIRHILDQRPLKSTDGPIGLILAPTRELSLQIVAELKPFLSASGLTIKCAYGGSPIADQIAMLKRGGVHVLCATAGRLIDLLASNSGRVLNFKRVTYVVLDEADRMFDMGFEPQVMKILQNVRPDRQTILFSATFPKDMASLARKALTDSAEVTIGGRSKVAPEITQIIDLVPPSYEKKVNRLLWHLGKLFSEQEEAQILIFTQRQEVAEDLLSKLFKAKYPLTNAIHGAKEWSDRIEAMNAFKKGDLQILIATSVAARGLDVPGLAMVLNFDCPTHLEDYVHRCGRTGRAGNKGTAVTLVEHPGQERYAVHIVKALKESDTEVPEELQKMADSFMEKVKSGEEKYYGGFGGRGIERLDAARALEKRREKRALKLDDDDESEEEVEELPKPEVAAKATDEPPAADTRPSWMKLLDSKIVVSKTERPDPSTSNKNLTAREKAALAASKVDGRLSKKGMIHAGQPIDNKGPDAGAYHSTVEINDFPQKARWAVTNRTNVAKILDQTGVSITTKGNFYPAGKEPGENELPKLYILVEGDTENIVTEAMMELTRLLREGTMADETGASTRGPTGRYNVV